MIALAGCRFGTFLCSLCRTLFSLFSSLIFSSFVSFCPTWAFAVNLTPPRLSSVEHLKSVDCLSCRVSLPRHGDRRRETREETGTVEMWRRTDVMRSPFFCHLRLFVLFAPKVCFLLPSARFCSDFSCSSLLCPSSPSSFVSSEGSYIFFFSPLDFQRAGRKAQEIKRR